MNDYYYISSASSLTKKLMAITMLLILTNDAVTVSGKSSWCSITGPLSYGPCEYVYADCVNNVITYLRDKTPYTKGEAFSTYYPADTSAGYVAGFAACVTGTSFTDCQNCLYAAKDWLDQNCPVAAVGAYFGGICGMKYTQQFNN